MLLGQNGTFYSFSTLLREPRPTKTGLPSCLSGLLPYPTSPVSRQISPSFPPNLLLYYPLPATSPASSPLSPPPAHPRVSLPLSPPPPPPQPASHPAMSGWDEGAVFYSDQAQFPRGGPGGDPSADLTRHSALRKFKEFLRGFTGPTGDFPYRCAPPSLPDLVPRRMVEFALTNPVCFCLMVAARAWCTTATMSPSPSRTSTPSTPSCPTRSGSLPLITYRWCVLVLSEFLLALGSVDVNFLC